jgi:methyl-accepting chemotaxis protein
MASAYPTSLAGLYQSNVVIVNGVARDLKEWKKSIKKATKAKKAKKFANEVRITTEEVKTLVSSVKIMRSLTAYYNNAYKQWGRIARTLINFKGINRPFLSYILKANEVEKTIKEIAEIGKKGEKAVFQYIQKLAWQMEDVAKYITELAKGVNESGIMRGFKGHECIEGEGRRLGIRILVQRSSKAVKDINEIVCRLTNIAENGTDALNVANTLSYNDKMRVGA